MKPHELFGVVIRAFALWEIISGLQILPQYWGAINQFNYKNEAELFRSAMLAMKERCASASASAPRSSAISRAITIALGGVAEVPGSGCTIKSVGLLSSPARTSTSTRWPVARARSTTQFWEPSTRQNISQQDFPLREAEVDPCRISPLLLVVISRL